MDYIPEGEALFQYWADNNRVEIVQFLDDVGMPYSCAAWGEMGEAGIPPIIDDGIGSTVYDWFTSPQDTYPLMIFIDHNMTVINIMSTYPSLSVANFIIEDMLDALPVTGCTDPDAENYDPSAGLDDGSCEYVERGTISGTVTFGGGWPAAGNVSISIYSNLQPTGPPISSIVITPGNLIGANQFNYSFANLFLGTYGIVLASWQDPDDENLATNQHILGAHSGDPPLYTDAENITITATDNVIMDLDFTADLCKDGEVLSMCTQNYDYLLTDINPSSETYGIDIGPGYFQNQVTLHYFGHQS